MRNCHDSKKKMAHFEQPVLQTTQMFVGEMGCWIIVGLMSLYRRFRTSRPSADRGYQPVSTSDSTTPTGRHVEEDDEENDEEHDGHPNGPPRPSLLRGYRITLLALPAICDICGTTLMNAGLLLVAASIYQMTRGALVLFVGLFSVLFLKRHLRMFQWLSLAGVVLGVAIVGMAGVIWPDTKAKQSTNANLVAANDGSVSNAVLALTGVLLIAGAQIFTATQFVLEEWILENSDVDPIKVVGWEGIFGFLVTLLAMVILHLAIGRTDAGRYGPFDINEGWRQITTKKELWVSSLLIMVSIG